MDSSPLRVKVQVFRCLAECIGCSRISGLVCGELFTPGHLLRQVSKQLYECPREFASHVLAVPVNAQDEVSLFDGRGKATAYIAVSDGLTIYLWNGKPVAYMDPANSDGYHVYGFNGKHLGWFVNGVIWDHGAYAACAAKERLRSTQIEPFKAFKQFKPFKAFKEFAPFRPTLSGSFGDVPCLFLLAEGGA
jgi:hypothetical protein